MSALSGVFAALLFLVSLPAFGARADEPGDRALLDAYDAYRAGDAMKLARHATRAGEAHVLAPWLAYWRLSLALEDAAPGEVAGFLAANDGSYVAERLRREWAGVLGKRAEWDAFDRERARLAYDDLELRCFSWRSRQARGEAAALAEAEAVLVEPKPLPEGCVPLLDALASGERLGADAVWTRVRVLFENGQITAAKAVLDRLERREAPDERLLAEAARNPKRVFARLPKASELERRPTREVVVLAGVRLARTDPAAVAEALREGLAKRLPPEDARYLWGRIGYEAARRHEPEALEWFARAGDVPLADEVLAWKARAGLRAKDWSAVRDAIDRMSVSARRTPAWSYWYGRALAAQGEREGAKAYYTRIAGQPDFYGLLADEELGYLAALPEPTHVPAEADVAAAGRTPGLARALELIRLGLRSEGVREWYYTVREYDDARLLAAAELAHRAGVWDRAIQAADRTQRDHNFGLRYPTPFREVFSEYARAQGLEEAWIFGLVRQESRFVAEARSSAGAQGLMQLMPATARYVARKIGLRNYRPSRVHEVQTNVTLGTGYLRMVLDQLGHPVLASAAYNAGPGRARRWRDAQPLEGAIYVETIPFNETRDYVQRVMANAVFYSALLERKLTPLKARLGVIAPRGAGEALEGDLP